MKYEEIRTLAEEDLRSLCIQRGWYTNGTNEQYTRLFDRLRDKNGDYEDMEPCIIAEIAADIVEHSDLEEPVNILPIMFDISRKCRTIIRRKL